MVSGATLPEASMLRAETVGQRKAIRGGGRPVTLVARQSRCLPCASLRATKEAIPSSSFSSSADLGGGNGSLSFLDLPAEIRIMIYKMLLISPDPIIISPRRRHLRVRVSTIPATNGNTYLRARAPAPRKVLVQQDDRLHTELLRTCTQVNAEGTQMLYSMNSFLVGQLMPFRRGGGNSVDVALESGYYPTYFFPWHLRHSTLAQIRSVRFRKACYCTTWLLLDNKEHETDGRALRRLCFTPQTPAGLPPSPPRARAAFRAINAQILGAAKGPIAFATCPKCSRKYDSY